MPCVLLEELAADSWENKQKKRNGSLARRTAAVNLLAVVLVVFLAVILAAIATLLTIDCPPLVYKRSLIIL